MDCPGGRRGLGCVGVSSFLFPMNKLLLLGFLVLPLAVCAIDAPVGAPAPPAESPLAPLTSLVGGLWVGDVPVPKGAAPLKLELRFAWTENHRAIHFDSAFVGSKRTPYTSGLYAWDGAKGKLVIFYVDGGGDLTEGVITPEGSDTLVNELLVTEPTGKTYPVRVRLTKVGTEVFNNAIFLMKDKEWAPFVAVR